MKILLQKLLNKRGIDSVDQLSTEEKANFDKWDAVLSAEPLTVDKLKDFLLAKVGNIEEKWADLSIGQEKKAELIPYFTCYKALLGIIASPNQEKAQLEKYLQSLL